MNVRIVKQTGFVFFGVVALAVWITWPSGGGLNITTCRPSGTFPRLSLELYQSRFWLNQLEELRGQIVSAENWRGSLLKHHASIDEARQKTRDFMEKTYREIPKLKPTPTQRDVRDLRNAADDLEEHGQINQLMSKNDARLASLHSCEIKIKKHLDSP